MELIRIGDAKLKVMLSADDMITYAIDCEEMDYDNTETRRVVWQILDEAKKQTGFDAANDRVMIRVFPDRGGGCEIYVTKVEKTSQVTQPKSNRAITLAEKTYIYRFASMESLLCACSALKKQGYNRDSSAFADEDGLHYYLSVRLADKGAGYAFVEEYSTKRFSETTLPFLWEHSLCIAKQEAVETLGVLL